MNSLVIPPPPNWYETSILSCAPDNTLVYGSRNDIVVIQDTPNDQPAEVRIIPRAHAYKITCTSINRNWGQPNKLLVTVSEEKVIKLWNLDLMERKLGHHEHKNHGRVIAAIFAGDDKVISVSEEGVIIIWNISVNQKNVIKDLFGFKVTVTCMSICPHATWLTAFGLKAGLVVITDLRKEGKVLYKLRGHDKSVLSLAWCPAPVNIFPKDPMNYVGTSIGEIEYKIPGLRYIGTQTSVNTIEKQIPGLRYIGNQTGPVYPPFIDLHNKRLVEILEERRKAKELEDKNNACESKLANSKSVVNTNKDASSSKYNINKKNPWTDLKHADDDDLTQDGADRNETHPLLKVHDDFLAECQTLKNRILETSSPCTDVTGAPAEEKKVLKAKRSSDNYKQKKGRSPENKKPKAPIEGMDTTKEYEKNIAKTEISDGKVMSLCEYNNHLEKYSNAKEMKSFPNDLVDIEDKEILTRVKSEDADNKINEKEVTQDADVTPSNIVAHACVTEAERDDTDEESIKKGLSSGKAGEALSGETKQDLVLIPPASSTKNTSVGIQDKSMKKVHSIEDNNKMSLDEMQTDTSILSPDLVSDTEGKSSILEIPSAEDDCKVPSSPVESTCDLECKSTIVELSLNGEDSNIFEGKEIAPFKSENKSDGREVKNLTEELSPSPLNPPVAAAENGLDCDKYGNTAGNSFKGIVIIPEEIKRVSVDEEPRKEFLLASSGREGNIYIWRAGTDGRMQTFLTVPNKPYQHRYSRPNPDKIWIALCWITPNILLSSSKSAELIRWNLPKPRESNKQFVIIHNDHSSLLFSIAAPIIRLDESNWSDKMVNGQKRQLKAWSVGQDRLLLCTSIENERKTLACYPTIGRTECFAESPIDSNRIAIGTGEGFIRVWDISRPHIKNIIMSNFYQKIYSKVVSMAWHPQNEMLLAYGTSEGRVACLETNRRKTPMLLPSFFKSQVHKIEWGPLDGDIHNIGLYAVAEGRLVVFDTKMLHKGPMEVDTPDNTYIYTFAWKPNYEVLLVTTRAGAIITYSLDLKILSMQYLHHKLQHIYWHSTAALNDLERSKYCYYFAAISNFKELIVFNTAIKTNIGEEKIVAKFESNGDLINGAAWNPHSQPELVIAREDGVAQVWNVESNTVIASYINPNFEGLSSVMWSPCEAEFIITASRDHTIKIWNKTDFPPKSEKEISDLRKTVIKKTSNEAIDFSPKVEKPQEEATKGKKPNKNNLLPNFYPIRNPSQIIRDLRKLLRWKEGESRELLDNGRDNGHGGPNILDIFDSSEHMLKLIEINETAHKQKGKFHLDTTLSLFKGDIGTAIKAAIDEKRVTPWVIKMAPMVSHKIWSTACEVYAQQLSVEPDSDPLEIATLYLMCHKVEEAIKTLCEGALYREALALAKCRLARDDPTITNVIEQWGRHSLIVGNFEVAAQCDIFLGKYAAAASLLFRRSDVETLKFAVELAEKSGNAELHQAVLFRYNSFVDENGIVETEKKLPTKTEAILQRHQAEGSGRLLHKSDPTKTEEMLQKEQGRGNGKVELLQKSEPTKAEEMVQKDQGEAKGKVELSQKSEATEAVAILQKDQAEGNDEQVDLLQKSDPTKAGAILQNKQGERTEKVKLLQTTASNEVVEVLDLEEGYGFEQNTVSDLGLDKKSLSDESGIIIEDNTKENIKERDEVLSNVNAESLDSTAGLLEESCSGRTTAVEEKNEGLLTTEEVRKLLSNSKLDFLNDSEIESADPDKNSNDKCY